MRTQFAFVILGLLVLSGATITAAQPGDLLSPTAKSAFEKQNFAPCIAEMSKLILARPKNDAALVERARCLYLSADDTNDEKVILTEISKTIAEKEKAQTAASAEVMSRRNRAVDDATAAIAINPKNANAFNIRGLVKSSLGRKAQDESIADFDKAIEIDSKFVKPYFNRGVRKAEIDDKDGAIADFTKVIELDPKNAAAINYLAKLKEVVATKMPDTANTNQCVSGNCVNGKGKQVYSTGHTYEGDFVNGKREGRGVLLFKSGGVYTGQFVNDLPNGKGKKTSISGDTYEGDFVNDKFVGNGTYTFKAGHVYTGQFVNDIANGNGKLRYSNGEIYEGDFVNSKLQGKGKFIYASGDTYEGDFVDGKRVGQGIFTFKNGQVYVGQFSDGLRNGKGKFTFSDGSTYEGRFINDNFIGHGIYTDKSGGDRTGKFTVGQIVDLQSEYVKTYWGKAEIVEILGDKYKIRNLRNTSIEIVTGLQLRPFTPPDKYEIGQKVEVMDKGIWYAGEIIGNEVEYNDHYRIRFDGTSNHSDVSENVQFIRPLTSSSTAQTKQEISVSSNAKETPTANTPVATSSDIEQLIEAYKQESLEQGATLVGSGIYPNDSAMHFNVSAGKTYVIVSITDYDPNTFGFYLRYNSGTAVVQTNDWNDSAYEIPADAQYAMKAQTTKVRNLSVRLMNFSPTRKSSVRSFYIVMTAKNRVHWLCFRLK
ncbi:MAG: hypothetical protein PSX80_16610 [bacterium]|nr:hypothetical protein [bacterium]